MSEELELATLYSDDRLLDCLAGRTEVSDPDVVSGLLAAFAAEVDTYPVLLADATLLSVGSHPALVPGRSRRPRRCRTRPTPRSRTPACSPCRSPASVAT